MSVPSERTQRLMREVNDRIHETLAQVGAEDGDFLCECGDDGCSDTVTITLREYLALRTSADAAVLRSASHAAGQPRPLPEAF